MHVWKRYTLGCVTPSLTFDVRLGTYDASKAIRKTADDIHRIADNVSLLLEEGGKDALIRMLKDMIYRIELQGMSIEMQLGENDEEIIKEFNRYHYRRTK